MPSQDELDQGPAFSALTVVPGAKDTRGPSPLASNGWTALVLVETNILRKR